jgi:hypothetical protein
MALTVRVAVQNVPVRCFEMDVPKTLAMHLNVFRSLTTAKKIPDVAIHGFYKNYTQPEVRRGRSRSRPH